MNPCLQVETFLIIESHFFSGKFKKRRTSNLLRPWAMEETVLIRGHQRAFSDCELGFSFVESRKLLFVRSLESP